MSQFDNTKRKIQETFKRIREYRNEILIKENTREKLKSQQEKIKTPEIIYDSGWQGVAPTIFTNFRTTTKDDLVPVRFSYSQSDFDFPVLQLPDELFAYVDPVVMVKGIPGTEFKGQANFTFSGWGSDHYEVRGDGALIYQGVKRELGFTHSQDALDDGDFLVANTKKRFQMIFEYTKSGEHFRVVGDVNRLQLFESLGENCDTGKEDTDRYNIAVDPTFTSIVDNEHRVLDTEDNNVGLGLDVDIEFKGDLFETRWVDTNIVENFTASGGQTVFPLANFPKGGASGVNSVKVNGGSVSWTFTAPNVVNLVVPAGASDSVDIDYQYCLQNITQTENVIETKDFTLLSRYILRWGSITTKFKLDAPGGSPLSSVSFAGGEIDSDTDIDTANDLAINFLGYFLYWSGETRWLFGIETELDPIDPIDEGSFFREKPSNLPELSFPNASATLPYTAITFKRNPGDFPEINEGTTSLQGNRKQIWLKTSKSMDATKTHILKLQGTAVALQPASEVFEDLDYNVYDDIYTQIVGPPDTYDLTTESHTTKNRKTYVSNGDDAQIKVVFSLKNPAYWEELRRYVNE